MSPRRKRIARIAELRDKALQNEIAELTRADAAERAAEEAERRAREHAGLARERLRKLGETGADAATFLEHEAWLSTLEHAVELARHRLNQARALRGRVQLKVKALRVQLKQVEKLGERLVEQERVAASRVERKLEDEIAGRGFFYDKRSGG